MAVCRCYGCMSNFDDEVSSVCPVCGYDQNTKKKEAYHLDPGTYLENRYLIGTAIGSGGFGVTYIAWDTVLDKKVAVKEYFPSEFATRMMGTTEVCSYDGEKSYQFEAGLKSFVDEARRLAKLNQLDGIVHIYDSFIGNCTAYIVMEYVEGETLKDMLKKRGPIPYNEVIEYVVPVLNALEEVHKEGIIHRDIAPDNIKINNGKVTLLDFGAARDATTVHSKSLSVIVKPGYAPEEQYRTHGAQGPWTDVYAMAAVMYHLITGKLPDESVERNVKDELKTPTELGFVLPVPVENAIMNALNVKAEYRIQTAKEFADALTGAVELERVVVKQDAEPSAAIPKKVKIATGVSAAAAVILILAIILTTTGITSFNSGDNIFPNLIGADEKQTQKLLKNAGLDNNGYQIVGILENVDGEAGTVVWQSVEPGERLDKDNGDFVVEVKMAEAEVVEEDENSENAIMPDLTAMTESAAAAALDTAGFTNYTFATKINNAYKEGLVCEQSLKAEKEYKKDREIVVYIAKNEVVKTTEAKNTKDVTKKETAASAVTEIQNVPETTKRQEKKNTARVTTTKPETTVETAPVPNVVGKTYDSAQSELRALGLFVQYAAVFTNDDTLEGSVQRTSPSAGEKVRKGSVVTIYVYELEGNLIEE